MLGELLSPKRLVYLLALGLMGCATGYAPVSDLTGGYSSSSRAKPSRLSTNVPLPKEYKVKTGDTLYSIAWKYGLDFKQLAIKNHISDDFLIYRGQILSISGADNVKTKNKTAPKLNKEQSKTSKTDSNVAAKVDNKVNVDAKNKPRTSKTSLAKTPQNHKKLASNKSSKVIWKWPVKTRAYSKFSNNNKGLDFEGVKGQNVYSAAQGKVVYAGNGIIGYGNLIIIKHSEEYLSAYAHNSVILVKDNDFIKVGEKIAEIGKSGTIKTILHFEIRRDGKPVNPLLYLPKN